MKQKYKQEVADLKNGLVAIQNILTNPKTPRRKYETAIINEQIQIARLEFFIRGYNFYKKEIKEQKKLR